MLFFLLINVKMPTVVGILLLGARKCSCSAELSMKNFYNLGTWSHDSHGCHAHIRPFFVVRMVPIKKRDINENVSTNPFVWFWIKRFTYRAESARISVERLWTDLSWQLLKVISRVGNQVKVCVPNTGISRAWGKQHIIVTVTVHVP